MSGCDLSKRVFDQRRKYSSCTKNTVIGRSFSNIRSTAKGGALLVSISGKENIVRKVFSNCSTSSIAGAVSCTTPNVSMNLTCFFDCFAAGMLDPDTAFHAVKIFGTLSKNNIVNFCQCTITLCSKVNLSTDEALGIWYDCVVVFQANNFTKNSMRS